MEFRYAFYGISKGGHPDDHSWPSYFGDTRESFEEATDANLKSELLHRVFSEASIMEITASCPFPDYLGYLGLGLFWTSECEKEHRLLTSRWGEQLIEMVEPKSSAEEMLRQRISDQSHPLLWEDLESVEFHMRRKFRTIVDANR